MPNRTEDGLNILERIVDKLNSLHEATHRIDKEVALQKAALEDHLQQHTRMLEEASRTNSILQENTDSLKEHMRRTDLLETLVEKMDARLTPLENKKIAEEAIAEHKKATFKKWGKIIGITFTVVGGIGSAIVFAKPFIVWLLSL